MKRRNNRRSTELIQKTTCQVFGNLLGCCLPSISRELPTVFHVIDSASRERLESNYASTNVLSLTGQISKTPQVLPIAELCFF
ncbi:MAG: hypothetical protein LBS69_03525 [Prevotellaceae bacterium]|jgi:hypothetical protein|nr:hypothetical protein [Prevotellaceae bacterium]